MKQEIFFIVVKKCCLQTLEQFFNILLEIKNFFLIKKSLNFRVELIFREIDILLIKKIYKSNIAKYDGKCFKISKNY